MQLIKSRSEATGMAEHEVAEMWHHMPASPFRRVVEYELEARRLAERDKLETDLTSDQYHKQKGILEGIRIAIGILNRKDNPTKKS